VKQSGKGLLAQPDVGINQFLTNQLNLVQCDNSIHARCPRRP
jgi:hypothetical protein